MASVLLYSILSPPFDRPILPPPLTYFPILLKGWYWQSHFSVTDTSQPSAERWCIQWMMSLPQDHVLLVWRPSPYFYSLSPFYTSPNIPSFRPSLSHDPYSPNLLPFLSCPIFHRWSCDSCPVSVPGLRRLASSFTLLFRCLPSFIPVDSSPTPTLRSCRPGMSHFFN